MPRSEAAAWLIAYPDQFRDGERPGLDALRRFTDHRFAPGITGVHVLPVHPWSSDGGFSITDHSVLADGLGGWDAFSELASRFEVMADAVVNHVSAKSVWFAEFLAGDPARAGWFKTIDPGDDLQLVVRPRSTPLSTPFVRADGSTVDVWTTFGPDQVDLDFAKPEVLLAMFDVVFEYVSRGAAAVRLDAIAFLWKQSGTTSVHLPQTHAVVELLHDCLAKIDPSVMLVTETNVSQQDNMSYLGTDERPEADAVYQFALPPLVLHALATGDAGPLNEWAEQLDAPRPGATFLNFLACHDGVGLRPARGLLSEADVGGLCDMCRSSGGVVNEAEDEVGGSSPYELASSWFDLCSAGVSPDEAIDRHLASHAVVFALRGVPLVYVHSLLGTSNDMATYESTGHGRDLNRRRLDVEDLARELDNASSRAARVWSGVSRMLDHRRSSPAFHPDSDQAVLPCGPGMFAIERRSLHGDRALVVVNLGRDPSRFDLPPGKWVDSSTKLSADRSAVLPAWSSWWLHQPAPG